MAFCPLDYRYGCQDFKHIWSEVGRHERQLEVERALIWAHMQLGRVSQADYEIVKSIANPTSVTKERVSEIEAETEVEPSPTNEPIIPAQNRAPSINLSSVECLEELRKDDSTIQVEIIVTDEDDSTAIIDLSAEINEESIDLSEWISNGTTLDVPGTAIAYVPMLPGTETYLLLIAHAAYDDGEVSEAAVVIPNN